MRPRVDDVTFDDAGQLAFFDHDANKDRSLRYDGRGFLSTLADASGSIDLLRPAYSSEGLLHSLLREPTSLSPHRLNILYFAGRPIGIWKKVGTSTATLTRIVTDHLGTPVASLQQAGATLDWHGGFEPFGEDWQAGTLQDSLAKGIFLRLPGQWKDPLWSDATYPMELFYNLHRWYEARTGRYASADPVGIETFLNLHTYVNSNPLRMVDPDGRRTQPGSSPGAAVDCVLAMRDVVRIVAKDKTRLQHCLGNCLITKYCPGRSFTAWAASSAKELSDLWKCKINGLQGNCDSYWQPEDFKDNRAGRACKPERSCEEHCSGYEVFEEPSPGPLGRHFSGGW